MLYLTFLFTEEEISRMDYMVIVLLSSLTVLSSLTAVEGESSTSSFASNSSSGDTAPNINYSHNMRILKLPKITPVGTIIYRLKGSDPDPGDVLSFGSDDPVGQSLLEIRTASFTEADVYLKAPLSVSE